MRTIWASVAVAAACAFINGSAAYAGESKAQLGASAGCTEDKTVTVDHCIASDKTITSDRIEKISERNAEITNKIITDNKCVVYTIHVAGSGEDCLPLTNVCNCKGTGWLEFQSIVTYND